MGILLSIGEGSRLLGVCVNTIRNWEVIGKLLPTCRTFGGHRRYRLDKIQNLRGESETNPGLTIAYARVSSHDQKTDLERQKVRLQDECKQRGYDNVELIADLGSGLNFTKKGLRRLLRLILTHQVQRLVVIHKDRLLRFGAELIFDICKNLNIEVVVVESTPNDISSCLENDVIELMTVFSARMYGARSHKNSNFELMMIDF